MIERVAVLMIVPLLGLCVGCRQRNGLSDTDRAAVHRATDDYAKLFRANDWRGLMGYYTEDAAWLPPNLPAVEGRAAIEAWAATWPRYSGYEQETLEIEGQGDFAYERGTYSMTVTVAGAEPFKERGKYIAIWRRQSDGSWKVW